MYTVTMWRDIDIHYNIPIQKIDSGVLQNGQAKLESETRFFTATEEMINGSHDENAGRN